MVIYKPNKNSKHYYKRNFIKWLSIKILSNLNKYIIPPKINFVLLCNMLIMEILMDWLKIIKIIKKYLQRKKHWNILCKYVLLWKKFMISNWNFYFYFYRKIVHRDLKGANIFLSKDSKIKIGDFGISKAMDKTVLASKSFAGTPYYLSPEMV